MSREERYQAILTMVCRAVAAGAPGLTVGVLAERLGISHKTARSYVDELAAARRLECSGGPPKLWRPQTSTYTVTSPST